MVTGGHSKKIYICRYLPVCMAPFPYVKKFSVFTFQISNISDFYIPLFFGQLISFLSFLLLFPTSSRLCFFFVINSACSSFLLFLLPLFFFLYFRHPFTPVSKRSSVPYKLTFKCNVLCAFPVQTFQSTLVHRCRFVSSAVQQTLQGLMCGSPCNLPAATAHTNTRL